MDQYKNEKQPKSQQSETNNDQESNAVSDHANSAQSEQLHRPLQQPQKNKLNARNSQTDVAPKKNWINDLDLIGSIVMIAFLFFGTFYKGDGGFYSVKYNVTGYKMLFNTDFIMGTLLLLCPAITLITNYVTAMKKSEKLIKLVMPILALILVFVLKSQLSSELDYSGGSMGLGFSGIVYLIAGLVSLIAAVARFLNQDLSQKIKGKK